MVAKIKIGDLNIRFILRHRFEKKRKDDYQTWYSWKDWRLGFWFKKTKAVGKKNFKNPSTWNNNLVNIYTFGIDVLIVKMWLDVDYGVKHFEI